MWPKTNNKKILRRMLSDRDRQLSHMHGHIHLNHHYWTGVTQDVCKTLDEERKLIRIKLKKLGRKHDC